MSAARTPPSVAVIIVAWRDHDDLDLCLGGLANQTDPDFVVVVADNGAGLRSRVAAWRDRLDIRHVALGENAGPSRARNVAVAATGAQLLLFLDDDAVPDAAWVESMRAVMVQGAAVAARGRVVARGDSSLNDLARAYDLGAEVRPAIINTEGNCAIWAAAYRAVGGFREDMFGHEGAEISQRLLELAGYSDGIVYTPHAVIRHDYASDLGGYLRKKYRHGTMLRHVDPGITRWAASRGRRRSPWTPRRLAMAPVKALGLVAEVVGVVAGSFPGRRGSVAA